MSKLKGQGTEDMKGENALEAFEDAKPNRAGGGSPPAGAGDGGTGSKVDASRTTPLGGSGGRKRNGS